MESKAGFFSWLMYVDINIPIGSMYDIFTYIWLILLVNVGKYSIHGSYGIWMFPKTGGKPLKWMIYNGKPY